MLEKSWVMAMCFIVDSGIVFAFERHSPPTLTVDDLKYAKFFASFVAFR